MKLLNTSVRISNDYEYAPAFIQLTTDKFIKLTHSKGMIKMDLSKKIDANIMFLTMIHYIPGTLYRKLYLCL